MRGSPGLHLLHKFGSEPAGGSVRPDKAAEEAESSDESPAVLAGIIEGQIIPRLLCVHREVTRELPDGTRDRIAPEQADGFAAMVMRLEAHALLDQVDGFLARGASVESVLVDLLAPAARQMGVWWEEDSCDFVDVTMGLWRLQQIVHELSARIPGKAPFAERAKKALFTVFPYDDHSFGAIVVDEVFRRQGWQTACLTTATDGEVVRHAGSEHFDLIGLTISQDAQVARASDLIARLRTSSKNPLVGVMVGGRILNQSPELALKMGADATAPDAESAVARAEIMLQALDQMAVIRC